MNLFGAVLCAGLGAAVPMEALEDALACYRKFPRPQAEAWAVEFGLTGSDRELFIRALKVWPLIRYYARAFGVDTVVAFRIAATESGFREHERGAAGEVGVYQLLPSTARVLWRWHRRICPEPTKSWETSTPNQICLALKHIANIQKNLGKPAMSLRAWQLREIYSVYAGGPMGLRGKSKGPWALSNLRATKSLEPMVEMLNQLSIERVRPAFARSGGS